MNIIYYVLLLWEKSGSVSQEYFRVLCVGDDVEEVLREDVEGVWVVEGEDEDGGLGVLVVAGGDAGHALHAARVPKLELQGALRRRK